MDVHDLAFLKQLERGEVQGVLKRDYCTRNEQIITPKTEDLVGKIQRAMEKQERTWNMVKGFFGQPRWFVLPFIAHSLLIGEVRAFLVDGRLVFKMTTTPSPNHAGEWKTTDTDLIRPIHARS